MSASLRDMRGGQPSTTQPIAGPWLSPQVVTRNNWPKLLCDMPAYRRAPTPPPLAGGGRGEGARELTASPLHNRNIWRGRMLHPDDMVAAVDMVHFAGHPGRQVRQQVHRSAPDILDGDIALQRRIKLIPAQNIVEVANP